MAFDPNQKVLPQLMMEWNNTYTEEPEETEENGSDIAVHDRMRALMENDPTTFRNFCASVGIDHERYAEDLRIVAQLEQEPGIE